MVAQTKRRPVQPGQRNLALIFFLAKLAKQDLHATERNELGFDGSDGKNVPVKMKHLQGNAMCPISAKIAFMPSARCPISARAMMLLEVKVKCLTGT